MKENSKEHIIASWLAMVVIMVILIGIGIGSLGLNQVDPAT